MQANLDTRRTSPPALLVRRLRPPRAGLATAFLGLGALLLGACAGGAGATSRLQADLPRDLELPRVDLDGQRIIGCCCPTPCPCRLNRKPTYHHGCDYTTAVHLERGTIDGVPMDGLSFVFVGGSFAEEPGDNWSCVYVDERASEEQLGALTRFFGIEGSAHASHGTGPYVAGRFEGLRRAPIRYTITDGGRAHACVIEGVLDLRTRAIVNPGRDEPVVSTGVLDSFGDTFVHAECEAHVFRDAALPRYAHDLTGRQANFASFHIGTEEVRRLARGSLGWSCWSAHADRGDSAPYEEDLVRQGHR